MRWPSLSQFYFIDFTSFSSDFYLMASSSSMASPASSPYPHYDVFLNHRGADVKATFAKDLYHRLTCSRLQVFLDVPEMNSGRDICAEIEAAIGVASVHVAIFSPGYAESKWCLEELALMVASMESRAAIILPVFYNVKPSELQYAGRYSEALRIHEEKKHYDLQTIQKWRDALRRVAKISGFDRDACNGNEEELLEKVVQAVLERVPKPPLDVAKFPTGLGEKLQELQTTVLSHEEGRPGAKVVGIVGCGGIGKTTLAKEYFNRQRSEYGGSSFLFDVRENAARKSLHSIQSNLLKDLKGMNIRIDSCEEGIGELTKNLKVCDKVLVILDDVDHLDQLNAFLPIKDVLHPKSLILVTSRDKGLLIRARIAESSIYHLSGLNRIHSQQLFCSHAFSQSYPPPEYENLVDGFLKACDGLPSSLKVFGARLYGKYDQSYWEDVLRGLNKTPHPDIH